MRAESAEDEEASFAELLARRTRSRRPESERMLRPASFGPRFSRCHQCRWYSTGESGRPHRLRVWRDAFVEALYSEILGRPASESEVVYWDKLLVLGVTPQTIADRIWFSMEHRSEVQNGTAPGIPLK